MMVMDFESQAVWENYLRLEQAVVEAEEESVGNCEEGNAAAAFVEEQRVEEAPVGVVGNEGKKVQGFGVQAKGDHCDERVEEGGHFLNVPGNRGGELDGCEQVHEWKPGCLL